MVGSAALVVAVAAAPGSARAAAVQDWPPFVLVAGLLVVGLIADDDGLFAAAGARLARTARHPALLFTGAVALVTAVTATLNLDTAVAFVTPVLVHTARRGGRLEPTLLYSALMLANAGSLFLPGSNLTNLIVLAHLHLTGSRFLAVMWKPALVSVVVTAAVVGVVARHVTPSPAARPSVPARSEPGPGPRLGLLAVTAAVACVLVLRAPAVPVAIVAAVAAGLRIHDGRLGVRRVVGVLGIPWLAGLFGVAVGLGTLGRQWSGPETLLTHLDLWATAAVAAALSVVVNNLPAASLLAARTPPHPLALLVGLNIGPNLFVTGSLAWLLWWRAARSAGAAPSLRTAACLGAVAAPLALVAAVGVLAATGAR